MQKCKNKMQREEQKSLLHILWSTSALNYRFVVPKVAFPTNLVRSPIVYLVDPSTPTILCLKVYPMHNNMLLIIYLLLNCVKRKKIKEMRLELADIPADPSALAILVCIPSIICTYGCCR